MSRPLGLIGLFLLSTAGCHRRDATLAPPAPAVTPPSAQASAESVLEGLDTRVPVPLLPHMAQHQKENMREHLVAVQDIALAASRGDFPAIEHASERLALSPGMARMCEHMGKGAAGFTEQALTFHRSADAITAAARRHDSAAVMNALGSTLQRCTGCHATFRQKIVDEATWTRLTADAPHAAGSGMSGG
jgi:hypothetical protein